jgi:uncharacterized membrane protein
MIEPRKLKVGDRVRNGTLLKGTIETIAAGVAVIVWQHTSVSDPIMLSSQFWRFLELDRD